MKAHVSIGCWAGAWGDTPHSVAALVHRGNLDFLVADYLAEVSLALLARSKHRRYVPDVITALGPLLREIHSRRIRVVTNAGGLDPYACRDALITLANELELSFRIAVVEGDDQQSRYADLLADDARDMFTGENLPSECMTVNAYLGARPIATALDMAADIVITGRCVDSALVLGPLAHSFGWHDDDYDLLAAGSLLGHIVECGTQCTGGLLTDWADVPGWDDMGMPIVECLPDGTGVVTKARDTGGTVTTATIGEQIVYEIGDPAAYVLPDVTCDWTDVRLDQAGRDRVVVSGARGTPPPATYKATVTSHAGYRSTATAMYTGSSAAARARRTGEMVVARTNRLLAESGDTPLQEVSLEVIGAGDIVHDPTMADTAREVVLKVGVRDERRFAADLFAREFVPAALSMGQGMAVGPGGRPRVSPAIAVHSITLPKASVGVYVELDGERREVTPFDGQDPPPLKRAAHAATVANPPEAGVTVPLRRIAHGRSGDKGNDANIGIIARHPRFLDVVRAQVTADRVADYFVGHIDGEVTCWEMPGMHAINFLLRGALGGRGGTTSLRYDPQGKSFAATLLDLPVVVQADLLEAP